MGNKIGNKRNANYRYDKQKEPSKRMGQTGFANMPEKPMFLKFSGEDGYRDGIINSFTCSVEDISGIEENEKYDGNA